MDIANLSLIQADSGELLPEQLRDQTSAMPVEDVESSDIPSASSIIRRRAILGYEQVLKLDEVMEEVMFFCGRGNFPTLEVKTKWLLKEVRSRLEKESITIVDIRLHGGAANYALTPERSPYNDVDIVFSVDLSTPKDFDRIRSAVLESLLVFFPGGVVRKRISAFSLKAAYIRKMVKVITGGDRWSLIGLGNDRCRNVELKFVDAMKRQYEFSVDSFQIVLDSYLPFCIYSASMGDSFTMDKNFYPTVISESVYGDFKEALYHIHMKLIATRRPEEIRGGGLFKYCRLLLQGYQLVRPEETKTLEKCMCSRFFTDFSDISIQRIRLKSYLDNHFIGDEYRKYEYLFILHKVINESSVCLMPYERQKSLFLIENLACTIYVQWLNQQQLSSSAFNEHYHHQLGNFQSNVVHQDQLPLQAPFSFGGGFFCMPIVPTYNTHSSRRWIT